MDKHHGQGGTYLVNAASGERELTDKPTQMLEGGGARDKDGKPLPEKKRATQPALPAPGKAPWERAAQAQKPATRKGA